MAAVFKGNDYLPLKFASIVGSLNTILEVDHLRTIDDMFAILAYWFQRRRI
jgi:hypothetical protein